MAGIIKAFGVVGPNGPVTVIGLTDGNIARLRSNTPIRLDLSDLGAGMTGVVILTWGTLASDAVAAIRAQIDLTPKDVGS